MERGVSASPTARDGEDEPAGSTSPALPSHFTFSTRALPADGKFDIWRDVSAKFGGVDVSTDSPTSIEGEIEQWSGRPLSIVRLNVTKSDYLRTRTITRNGDDDFRFTFCGPGMRVHTEQTGTIMLKQGGAAFLARGHLSRTSPPENCPSCILCIDREALLELMPRDFDVAAQGFAPGGKVLQLLENMVPLIANKTEPTTQERRETIGRQIIDLVALLLNPSRDGRAMIEERGLKAARIGAVLKAIDRRFANSSLSADSLGAELGISGRQVHRLLLETTKTFYEHLLERRLLQAHEMLLDPRRGDMKAMDIAIQTGFTNTSFFGQSFRRRFGDTPTGARGTAAANRTLRLLRQSLDGE